MKALVDFRCPEHGWVGAFPASARVWHDVSRDRKDSCGRFCAPDSVTAQIAKAAKK